MVCRLQGSLFAIGHSPSSTGSPSGRPIADSAWLVQHHCMRIRPATIFTALLFVHPMPVASQLVGPMNTAGCMRITSFQSRVTVSGRLTLQLFPGPPNYESIQSGDAEERTFIIELPRAACLDDGGEFADPSHHFVTVHVSSVEEPLMAVLGASVGRQVTVTGEGFAAHTGHHHAPLVVLADHISVD